MLGHRGCRLGLTSPEIYDMQVEAIARATAAWAARASTRDPRSWCRWSVPRGDGRAARADAAVLARVPSDEGRARHPDRHDDRGAAGRAGGRPDRRARRLLLLRHQRPDPDDLRLLARRRRPLPAAVRRAGILPRPVRELDRTGVGQLVELACERGRDAPGLKIGICGEHGGDASSIDFFEGCGLDYVSCSPYRVPVARVAAAQARIRRLGTED